jgi:hypothetical protein
MRQPHEEGKRFWWVWHCNSISSAVQYVTLQKYISHPSFSYLISTFSQPHPLNWNWDCK